MLTFYVSIDRNSYILVLREKKRCLGTIGAYLSM